MKNPPLLPSLLVLIVACGLPMDRLPACSVPVFRYALDNWDAERYEVVAPEVERSVWEDLVPVDDPFLRLELAKGEGVELRQPYMEESVLLTDRLTPDQLPAWLDSPKRREMVDRILAGDSAVYLILHEEKDPAAVVERVDARLRHLESVIELPELDPNDPADTLGPGPPLKVKFSTLPISRSDESEGPLLAMLTDFLGEQDTGETVVIPVFGRGRALGMIPIDDELEPRLDEVTLYLCGACSCQVKKLNPGWDLLVSVDWPARLEQASLRPAEEPRPAPAPKSTPAPESVTFGAAAEGEPTPAAKSALEQTSPGSRLSFGGVILILCTLAMLRFFRSS